MREVAWLLGPVTDLRWHSAVRPVILAAIARHTVTGALEGYRISWPELGDVIPPHVVIPRLARMNMLVLILF
jgi:hypothetical protein